mgnify:CR=1 FL=1
MYSQNNEEEVILKYLGDSTGTFLDIGAFDGITFSNTYELVKRGWKGVMVEASPRTFIKLQENVKDFKNNLTKLTVRMRLILIVFVLCFVVMIYGVSKLDWWFLEMTSVFFTGALLIGFISRINERVFVTTFVKGATELLGVAFIIGIARGVTILMEDGLISDTLLYYSSNLTNGMNKGFFINTMLYTYGGLSFFIPSSSGMAVLTMPIMSPLGDGVGVAREHIVNAYQYGMGLFAFINPTGLILASLAIVNIGYDKWLKFISPLVITLLIVTMGVLTISVYL